VIAITQTFQPFADTSREADVFSIRRRSCDQRRVQ